MNKASSEQDVKDMRWHHSSQPVPVQVCYLQLFLLMLLVLLLVMLLVLLPVSTHHLNFLFVIPWVFNTKKARRAGAMKTTQK